MTSYFSDADPRAQAKTLVTRSQSASEINGFIASNFSTVSPGTPVCACAFSSDQRAVAEATKMFSTSPVATRASEDMGEAGAVYLLKQTLAAQGIPFDPKLLKRFDGANAFNLVYFDAEPLMATMAIILEAKGGSSTLGTRLNAAKTNPVTQGTAAYANTVINVMSKSKATDRKLVGKQLMALQGATPPKILYAGVATKYDKSKKLVHNPVPIFATKV